MHNAGKPCPIPNPNGKTGGLPHQNKVKDVVSDIESRGFEAKQEYRVLTPGGNKESRYADVVAIDKKSRDVAEVHQVGKTNKYGTKVSRERKAIADLEGKGGTPTVIYHPYDRR